MFLNFKIESYKKGIVFSSGFNIAAKGLLFLQNVAIAYYFGAEATTDIYFYCYATILLLATFINSLDSSVLIPESMRLTEQVSKQESMKFLNFFIAIYLLIGIVITIIICIDPVDILLKLSNFDRVVLETNYTILLFSIPLFTCTILTNLFVNILTSYKFFTMPMVASIVNSIFSLLFLVMLHDKLNIISLLVGLLLAYIINIIILVYLMKKQLNWVFAFKFIRLEKKIWRNIVFAQVGNTSSAFAAYIPMYLLSGFNTGIITALNFGQKTSEVPNQLLTTQFSSVAGVKFNELYAKKNYDDLNKIFLSSTQLLLFILIPASFLMHLYGDEIITILYQRGSFNASAVNLSSEFFKYFGFLLPLLAINTIIARLFMATQKIKESFLYQLTLNSFFILAIFVFVKLMGVIGYPIATITVYIINVLLVYPLLKRTFPYIEYGKMILNMVKLLFLNVIIYLMIFYISQMNLFNEVLTMLIGGSLYTLLIIVTGYALKMNKKLI